MPSFIELARPMAERNVPTIRLRPRTKIAMDSDWPALATTDVAALEQWNAKTPDANCGAVAQARIGGVWFLEIDDPSVVDRIEAETGQKIPRTYRVRSRPGRGHFYWKQTAESIAMDNIAQSKVKHGDFSVRVNNEYVVAANSTHPISGEPYTVVSDAPIIECPSWLIDWVKAQQTTDKKLDATLEGKPIPYGQHDSTLYRIACSLRNIGLEEEGIYNHIVEVCEKRCERYGEDYLDMCRKKAIQACKYSVGSADPTVYMGPKPLDGVPLVGAVPATLPAELTREKFEASLVAAAQARHVEGDAITAELGLDKISYPKFPKWVMTGTSIYNGLVKPYCDVNSRHEEFMFMPAVTLLLNYVANKVRIEQDNIIPSLYLACVGKRGEIIKSSCAESAMEYSQSAGILEHAMSEMENANGKQLVWEAGSPEGLGLDMSRLKCRNAVLYYDEMTTLIQKAGIQSSGMRSKLLTIYESGKYQNKIKNRKESFSFEPRSYCVSLILCSPIGTFRPKWAEMNEKDSGFDDRFFILLQPEVLKPMTVHLYVDTKVASGDTRRLIDKAINRASFPILDRKPLQAMFDRGFTNRQVIRAEKFALYFAIDLGLDVIDEDCVERGVALVEYESQVKKHLRLFDSVTKEGNIQQQILAYIEEHGGVVEKTLLEDDLGAMKYGTSLWYQAYSGLLKNHYIRQEGTGTKGDPARVRLLKKMVWGDKQ